MMKTSANNRRLIETDEFPFEFLSRIGERESWRKEVHRPIYHVHKWWAKRLGSVFRGILLGSVLADEDELAKAFYRTNSFTGYSVFDPFMGSGTTIGEAHKLGMNAIGCDINPVAVAAVRVALGPLDREKLVEAYESLAGGIGKELRSLYAAQDSRGRACQALYFFWVMQADCPACRKPVDLFPSWIIARNAAPHRKPQVQILCPKCRSIFPGKHGADAAACANCNHQFDPRQGNVTAARARCSHCAEQFKVLDAVKGRRPSYRLYGKLVLTADGNKEYVVATDDDIAAYQRCSKRLSEEVAAGALELPTLALASGYNTKQALRYGFLSWRDFFNDRQILALGLLRRAIGEFDLEPTRNALAILFSGVLEFNNLFASYKGEGTGAVRHMFSHHILKPERTPIEAQVWGTPKSSGSFSNLFRSRLLRAVKYRLNPTEVNGRTGDAVVCSPPFTGELSEALPRGIISAGRAIFVACGDSANTGLAAQSVDLVVTDPPFFDNVHYSELADFFYAWQQTKANGSPRSTRAPSGVQDTDRDLFASKLQAVFSECHRVLKNDGLMAFTYHHSRSDGWNALLASVLRAGFVVVNAQPVKGEMSVATPKSQAKEPIQLDIVIVCRKSRGQDPAANALSAERSARSKLTRLNEAGFALSANDCKVVVYGQFLTICRTATDIEAALMKAERTLASLDLGSFSTPRTAIDLEEQRMLF